MGLWFVGCQINWVMFKIIDKCEENSIFFGILSLSKWIIKGEKNVKLRCACGIMMKTCC
jgi:hypothetical protein